MEHISDETKILLAMFSESRFKNKLVAAYIEIQLLRDDIQAVLQRDGKLAAYKIICDEINQELGTLTRPSRLMCWRCNAEKLPKRTAAIMRREVLQYLFGDDDAGMLISVLELR